VLSEQASSLYIDQQDNYWIASGNGISIYQKSNQYYKLHQVRIDDHILNREPLNINAQSAPGKVWLATNMGLFDYDLKSGKNQPIKINLPIQAITTILADEGKLWLGVHNQLICLDTRSKTILKRVILDPGIYFIRKGNDQDLWIGLWTGGLYRLNVSTGEINHFFRDKTDVQSLKSNSLITGLSDRDTFWVGYNAGIGFSAYSLKSDSWSHYHPQGDHISNSSTGTITVMTNLGKHQMWLGTHGGGVFRFDPMHIQFTKYDQNQGLQSNYINSILPDASGALWISTADGMNYMNTETGRVRSLNIDLIFTDNDFVANGIQGLNGMLYFFCNHEFVEIDPAHYSQDHTFPQLVISSVTIFDKDKALPQHDQPIRLSYQENYFSFGFSAIKTHPFKKATYAYKLEGFNRDWITTTTPYASYTNVPDGNYVFKVKTTNHEGEWSEPLLHIPIHIKPPFWRTWWFITLCIVSMISGAYLFYQYRIQQIKKLFAVRTKISQDLHDEVGSTLSSIHVYSSVAAKAMQTNPEATKNALQQIKQNTQEVMENMSDIVWAINTGIDGQMTLGDKLKNYGFELLNPLGINCSYDIERQAEKRLVNIEARKNVLLIAKEAMNNIAKYSAATEASFQLGIIKGHLHLKISDNGVGFRPGNTHKGNGLFNMQHRISSLGGTFHLDAAEGKGTTIQCRIPLTSISDTWSLDHP
jgi:streptogramin lyase